MATLVKIVELNSMPFDRHEDGVGFVHATGRELIFDDPRYSRYEYEDDYTVDLPTDEYEADYEEENMFA